MGTSGRAQEAGIAAAKGTNSAYRGRKPSYGAADVELVVNLLNKGTGIAEIA